MTIYKGNYFYAEIALFDLSLYFFFAIRNMNLITERFFFPVKKVAFFSQLFSKANALLQWNKSPSPACTGGAVRWEQGWGTIRCPCISCSAAMQGKAETIHRLNTALKKTSCGSSTPGACKCIFVLFFGVPGAVSALGCCERKGGLWTHPRIQMTGINGPGMLQL